MESPKQASLGRRSVVRNPVPDGCKLARVTKVDDYDTKGQIEVTFLRDKGMPTPVWVVEGGAARKPAKDDFVLIGFLDNQGNNPYLAGFYNAMSHTSNFVYISDDKIRVQFPTTSDDIYDSSQPAPIGGHLTDDSKLVTRIYVELKADGLTIHAPAGIPVKVVADTITFNSADGTPLAVARQTDTVQVDLTTGAGTITSGSSIVKAG